MRLRNAAYFFYQLARKAVKAAGLTRVMRGSLGPIAGRMILRLTASANRQFSVHGHSMLLASKGRYPPLDMAMDRYEPGTTHLVERLLEPGMVVVDVGAHVGYYTLLAAKQVGPKGKVYAFEPESANYALLEENIGLNGYQNIVTIKSAVSSRSGSSTLYLTALDNGRHSTYHHDLPENGSEVVKATTLDAFLEGEEWPRVDLVKMDVEGAEEDVFQGMERLLRESEDLKIVMEFNPRLLENAEVDPRLFLQMPAARGFKVYCIDDKEGLLSLKTLDTSALVSRLLANSSSVNLFCTRQ